MKVWQCDFCGAQAADDETICAAGWLYVAKVYMGNTEIFGHDHQRLSKEALGYFCSVSCLAKSAELRAIEAAVQS